MPVPKEILAVKRPKNTVVFPYGKNKDKFAVKERTGCKYDNGRRIPITGATIGHIINNEYVPIERAMHTDLMSNIELKEWADVTLCNSLFMDILDLERNEPVCSKCFLENMLDIASYIVFFAYYGIKSGLTYPQASLWGSCC